MRALRLALNVVGFVLAPAFAAGAITFAVIDHLVGRGNDQRHSMLADEASSWLNTQPRSCP